MGHCYGIVGAVVYDYCGHVGVCNVSDFLSVGAVPCGHQRHPGGAPRDTGEPDIRVARLPVLREGRDQHQTSGFSFRRVLAIPTALGFLRLDHRGNGVEIRDVDKRCVPLLLLCDREVQAKQVDEAKRKQPRRESQTAASSDERRCHSAAAAAAAWRWTTSSGYPPKLPSHPYFTKAVRLQITLNLHNFRRQNKSPDRGGV